MTIRRRKVGLALLAWTAIAWAQKEVRIPAAEVHQVGAPVRIRGEVTAKDQQSENTPYTFEGDLYLTNESTKPILLLIMQLDVISPFKISLNYTEVQDYFFESSIPQPGSTVKLHRVLGAFGEPKGPYETFPVESSAHARVVFVQFVDGSSWGDFAAAKKALRDRQLSLHQLEILREESKKEGQKEFAEALSQPTNLQPISQLQDLFHEGGVLAPVVAKVNGMLDNASARSTP